MTPDLHRALTEKQKQYRRKIGKEEFIERYIRDVEHPRMVTGQFRPSDIIHIIALNVHKKGKI